MRRIACIVAIAAVASAGVAAQGAVETVDLGQAVVVGAWAPSELSPTAATVVIDAEEIAASGASTLDELLDGRAGLEVREYGYPARPDRCRYAAVRAAMSWWWWTAFA
ncbi:MAG TPA: hypothetical protein PLW80_06240 [Spirochaetales bacterium]|nr:hypothetical protein [Spirochaetales bacterium]